MMLLIWKWLRPHVVQPDPQDLAVVTRLGHRWLQLRTWRWEGDRLTMRVELWQPSGKRAWASVVRGGGEPAAWEKYELPAWKPEWN